MSRQSPLKLKFVITSLPVGGAETLLLNLVERLDRRIIDPEVVCLKEPGELGPEFSKLTTVHSNVLHSKWDLRVVSRLRRIFTGSDAVITVGAGDKMFWGRLSARLAGVPVVCSALHSTGWPDGVGRLNRMLTRITDGFIAVAKQHAEHLARYEKFPQSKVFLIPNGVDCQRFVPDASARTSVRAELSIPENAPVVGIVAALREEKNHWQFVEAASEVLAAVPDAHFVIVGDGPMRGEIDKAIAHFGIENHVHLLGNRSDTPRLLAAMDAFCLTSKNEANPVSIMEALACQVPAVAPAVGSVDETVKEGKTGFLTAPLSASATAAALLRILTDRPLQQKLGLSGRQLIEQSWSLDAMVAGYEQLVVNLYNSKCSDRGAEQFSMPQRDLSSQDSTVKTGMSLPSSAPAIGEPLCAPGVVPTSLSSSYTPPIEQ